jgi:hypothetical protein
MQKITKKEMFAKIREVVIDNEEMVAFIDHEVELLDKRNTNKKPTKVQEENVVLMDKILEVLADYPNGATASEVLASAEEFNGLSNQKITALLTKLKNDGKVVPTKDKKRTIFTVA